MQPLWSTSGQSWWRSESPTLTSTTVELTPTNPPEARWANTLTQYLWLTTDPVEGEMDIENLISQLSDRLVIIMGGGHDTGFSVATVVWWPCTDAILVSLKQHRGKYLTSSWLPISMNNHAVIYNIIEDVCMLTIARYVYTSLWGAWHSIISVV